jgi:pyruvate/2-oxoglutarate dehydrogenase complex dihydrolipoamide dehydrogenase (E3) component
LTSPQGTFDFVIIGAGAAGEAALELARARGDSVAIVDRDLFGGSCAFWACMPTKSLLHAAAVHHAGGDYPWSKASDFRDYMISREGTDYPSDAYHEGRYREVGAEPIRGTARLTGPGTVHVDLRDGGERTLHGRDIIIAVGSNSRVPDLPGLDQIEAWDNRDATSTRELPASVLILGGGPSGTEMAQVFTRYGVPVTLVESNPRILARDHPSNSATVQAALEREGATVHTDVRAVRIEPGAGASGAHRVELSDGSYAEGHEIMVAVGRSIPFEHLGLETIGLAPDGRMPQPDEQLRIAPHVYVIGDPAGPELHTHLAHYQGEMAVRIASGQDVKPDYRAIPRAVYTDPEVAGVGLLLEQALEAGFDAFEATADLSNTAKGYTAEAEGHITLVVDRSSRTLLGAFMAGPGASELIHEAVLAIKLRVPLAELADTIHAFPTTARVLGSLFMQVHRDLSDGA